MKRLSNAVALALLGTALAVASTTTALAQAWPKPIRIIVPYAPGGASDSLTRTVARKMSEILGQPIIVENKPGGASTIGIAEAASAGRWLYDHARCGTVRDHAVRLSPISRTMAPRISCRWGCCRRRRWCSS